MKRKLIFSTGEFYHVFNKSVDHIKIFAEQSEYERMLRMLQYYQLECIPDSYSLYVEKKWSFPQNEESFKQSCKNKIKRVRIVAYCLMPTHMHIILQQLKDSGVVDYMRLVQNSYSHYFNIKHHRRGPLWIDRFGASSIFNTELLCYVTRYVHLNPVTAGITTSPQEWLYSSFREYVKMSAPAQWITDGIKDIEMTPREYFDFTIDYIPRQKELKNNSRFLTLN